LSGFSSIATIDDNYISGMRMGVAYYYGGPLPGYGQVVITHNTFDLDYDPGNVTYGGTKEMVMGISLYGTGTNADSVIIMDNIFANAQWYAIYQEGAPITGSISVDNNLFYNNNWFYWPDYQYPYQWNGTTVAYNVTYGENDRKTIAGWYDGPVGGFTFTKNIHANDPLFKLTGTDPEEQWALSYSSSPAYNTASDGTNIGAWQGTAPSIFDTGPGTYPSIMGTHEGTITPSRTITVSRLYTYPC
jgi:hypothetical protein